MTVFDVLYISQHVHMQSSKVDRLPRLELKLIFMKQPKMMVVQETTDKREPLAPSSRCIGVASDDYKCHIHMHPIDLIPMKINIIIHCT